MLHCCTCCLLVDYLKKRCYVPNKTGASPLDTPVGGLFYGFARLDTHLRASSFSFRCCVYPDFSAECAPRSCDNKPTTPTHCFVSKTKRKTRSTSMLRSVEFIYVVFVAHVIRGGFQYLPSEQYCNLILLLFCEVYLHTLLSTHALVDIEHHHLFQCTVWFL